MDSPGTRPSPNPQKVGSLLTSKCEGKGLNLPLILKLAIEARGREFTQKNAEIIKKLENII